MRNTMFATDQIGAISSKGVTILFLKSLLYLRRNAREKFKKINIPLKKRVCE